jgi:hypothetical protein
MRLSDEQIERRMQQLRETAGKYAKAKAEYDHLEDFKKSKVAILMKEAELQGFKTAAAQEREALAHPEYIQLLEGLKVANEEAERLRRELWLAELGSEIWRTNESSRRAEMRGYTQ